MARKILGIDVGTGAVAAVRISCAARKIHLDAHARVPLARSEDGDDALAEALADLADAVDPSGCLCAVSIPPGQAVLRRLSVPFENPKKIAKILPFELERDLPFALEEASIGFHRLGPPDDNRQTSLLAAAVESRHLKAISAALAAADIRPDRVTLGGLAAALRVAARQPLEDAFLVDVGGGWATVFALSRGTVCLARTFSTGSDGARRGGLLQERLRQSARAMEEMLPWSFEPRCAVVVGEASAERSVVSEALELPAIEPGFINETAGAPSWPGGSMDNALALALVEAAGQEGIDFQPGPTGLQKFRNEHRSVLLRTAILAGILLILALGGLIVDVYGRQQRLDLLNRQLAAVFSETFPEVTTVVDPLQQMRIKAQETRRAAGGKPGAGTRLPAIDILRQLSAGIPKEIDVGLGQVMIGPESVLVTGSTDGFDSVDRIKSGLGLVEGFRSVGITSATVDKNGGRVRFRVKIDL